MIEAWELYLKALQYAHEAVDRENRDNLLKEMLNVDSMEEVQKLIVNDWEIFNANCDGQYKNYVGEFTNFLEEYDEKLREFQDLSKQFNELINAEDFIHNNDIQSTPNEGDIEEVAKSMGMSDYDLQHIELAQQKWKEATEAGNKELAEQWHEFAENIRKKYGYSGGEDGSRKILLTEEEIKEQEKLVKQDGVLMTKREANLKKNIEKISSLMGIGDSNTKKHLAEEYSNILNQESDYLKEQGLNDNLVGNWVAFNNNLSVQYDYNNMEFQDFINKYRKQLEEYQALIEEVKTTKPEYNDFQAAEEIGDITSGLVNNTEQILVRSDDGTWMTQADADRLSYLRQNWKTITNAHEQAEAIRAKYGYQTDSWGREESITITNESLYNTTQNYNPYSYNGNSNTGSVRPIVAPTRGILGYDNGLEKGPITYTGLAMLHGTPSNPEYVVNSDQAYNMLYNLSRNKMPEYEKNIQQEGIKYILNGDIIIDGASDPKAFWDEVTRSMNNRSNVTKNR